MSLNITRDDVYNYRDHPGKCPFCGCAYTDQGHTPLEAKENYWSKDEDFYYQPVYCSECHTEWEDTYKFTGIINIINDNDESIDDIYLYDYESIVNNLIEKKELLPLLIGIHPDLTEMIEKEMKK